ncbi:MAG: class I SAM-dependent methyltransferase, partial [Pseudomonadota bacterium]
MFDVYQRDYGHVQGSFNLQSQVIWDIFLKFQKDHGISGHMFEIGVQFGKSAILSALHAHPNEALVYCDLYLRDDAQAHVSQVAGPGAAFLRKSSASISVERELIQEEKGYRWIHIDGNHSAQFVYNDLVIADRILDETGIVVLDDFFSVQYPQVTEAF